ncbi:hypothetical protein N182_13630 [Sinorhizobium sp. GL2]|nr:hypothetical protein N182_13630 [Sinorhizobium sp. GL2]
MTKFTIDAIRAHIRSRHPGCPEFAVDFFATEISAKRWNGCKLGMAVGITLQTFLRHNMTDYDQLLLEGVDREEAKRRVQPRVNRMIELWSPARQSKT